MSKPMQQLALAQLADKVSLRQKCARLEAENAELKATLARLVRKIDHGCANFNCSECDKD